MIKVFEEFENVYTVWLFPTDDRFESAIKSIPFLKKLYDSITQNFDNDFQQHLEDHGYNTNYIFIGKNGGNWLWYDFGQSALDWIKRENVKYLGPVEISKEEYERALLQLKSDKYNI